MNSDSYDLTRENISKDSPVRGLCTSHRLKRLPTYERDCTHNQRHRLLMENYGALLLPDFAIEIICLSSKRRLRKRSLNRCSSRGGGRK
jgi:hypothetical protein